MTWWAWALVAALAASATAILAKAGVKGVPSNLATALRTTLVTALAWGIVAVLGEAHELAEISATSYVFLALSGLATGVSWLAYFKALELAPASRVAPIDKSSLALTIVLAALVLHEPITWPIGVGAALVVGGALLTLKHGGPEPVPDKDGPAGEWAWWVFALISAGAAAATAILAKIGIRGVPSSLATALRCLVVLAFAWAIVLGNKEQRPLRALPRRALWFLAGSGLGTGISWLAYYRALELAPASRVAPIDKASLAFTILLAGVALKERISLRLALGVAAIIGGALLTLV